MIRLLLRPCNPIQQAFKPSNPTSPSQYSFPVLKNFKSVKKFLITLDCTRPSSMGTDRGLFRGTVLSLKKFIAEKIALGFTGTSELIFIGVFKSV